MINVNSIFFARTYNKQWSEANNALVDLLEFEIPKEERKHEKVFKKNKTRSRKWKSFKSNLS